MVHKNGVFTLPPHAAFLPNLAAFLLAESHENATPLTHYHIYLPTRRACRALADAFLELSDGAPLLLPHIRPIGDVEEDDIDIHLSALGDVLHLPPALPPLRRQMLLAQLIHKLYPDHSWLQILGLAQQLGFLLDQVMTEELSFDRLVDLVPENFAQHWGITLSFLTTLSYHWPLILQAENAMDASARRVALLRAQAAVWEKSPPAHPIIFAGSTGSIPATRHLMKVVSTLPQGRVILPGLDSYLSDDLWRDIPETHPQYTMKQFLDYCDIAREKVLDLLITTPPTSSAAARTQLIAAALSPHMDAHLDIDPVALRDISMVTAKTPRDEAMTIALHMREVLETPDKTACLVTPNRLIGQRVAQILKRWGIDIDDTAGKTLLDSTACDYLNRFICCVRDDFAPLPLLEFLHHPFHDQLFPTDDLYKFEKDILRTPRNLEGLDSLALLTAGSEHHSLILALQENFKDFNQRHTHHTLSHWIDVITKACGKFVDEHVMWESEGGGDLLQLLAHLHDESRDLSPMVFADAADIILYLAAQTPLRTAHLTHPRLTILGQLESRLMQVDMMILAGLNEGVWPENMGVSPFLSRPMRKDFGLPGLERSLGLSAHDFVNGFCAPRVVLTRSLQDDGAATTPARWLQRIEAVLERTSLTKYLPPCDLLSVAQQIDAPVTVEKPAARPTPNPPLSARPREIAATRLQTLQENPYRFYGEKILRLFALEDLDAPSTAAQRGIIIHSIMEKFIDATRELVPPHAYDLFITCTHDALNENYLTATETRFWWPRLERLAAHVIAHEQASRKISRVALLEAKGKTHITTDKGSMVFTAKADRIDHMHAGGSIIIDYKTGTPPSKTKVMDGRAPQLPLEALILADKEHGFEIDAAQAHMLRYTQLSGGKTIIKDIELKDEETHRAIENAREGIVDFTDTYLDPRTVFTAIMITDSTHTRSDIRWWNHLARTAEWACESDDDSDEEAA